MQSVDLEVSSPTDSDDWVEVDTRPSEFHSGTYTCWKCSEKFTAIKVDFGDRHHSETWGHESIGGLPTFDHKVFPLNGPGNVCISICDNCSNPEKDTMTTTIKKAGYDLVSSTSTSILEKGSNAFTTVGDAIFEYINQ